MNILRITSLLLAHTLLAASTNLVASPLEKVGHIHDLTFGGPEHQTLLLGTHAGLFRYDDTLLQPIGSQRFDIMGLDQAANDNTLFASGHPAKGGNTGLLRSDDQGVTFQTLSAGLNGPVDFHYLSISPANPQRIYGVYNGLQISRDGGHSWNQKNELPPKLLRLAASAQAADRLYAATEKGLLLSEDAGDSWRSLFPYPATAVTVTSNQVFAFVVGQGLIVADEQSLHWREVHNGFGAQVLLDLAVNGSGTRLVGLTQFGGLVESQNEGRTWQALPARPAPAAPQAEKGQALFAKFCQSCHGLEAVGETYTIEGLQDSNYLFAPALNGSMHAWHHTDDQLVQTIMEGSPRTERMPGWKDQLSQDDARAIITYLKGMWSDTQRRCQGPGHMDKACLTQH